MVKISQNLIRRMPKYMRVMGELQEAGITRVSSAELGRILGFTASQIRQDFSCFGEFGLQGYGYNVEHLREEIGKILGTDRGYTAVIVGCGSIGQALINNFNFVDHGIDLIAGFDVNPERIGTVMNHVPILDISEMGKFIKAHNVTVAVLAVPKAVALKTANDLIEYGIDAFWNFTNVDVVPPYSNVIVENVHLSDSLLVLSYQKANNE